MDRSALLYSCDDHLDMYAVPPGVFESRLSRADAERAPRVVMRDGAPMWVCEDRVLGRSGSTKDPRIKKLSAIGRAGIEDDGFRAGTPKLRLEDMDRDHLWASIVYGPLAIGLPIRDPALQSACYAAWNDWAVEEFNVVAPDRLSVLAFLPGHSAEAAAGELLRSAKLGHRGAILDVFDVDIADPSWDRLWAAGQETGLPVSFHIKAGAWNKQLSYKMGKWQSAAFASIMPLQLDEPLAIMLFSGALERHPGFRLVLAESGVGWLPYFLTRMDLEWRNLRDKLDYATKVPPSEIFRRQVMATFEEEALGEELIPLLGADACMWASDYPHTDSTFPNSVEAIEESLGSLSAEDRRKVTATNCARLYRFELSS
ncbi:MAG TPA: amidohydrolase family protein [Myxococcota bacterium]|nr:amidohydrolase family protein [Myxococcota bacterium]